MHPLTRLKLTIIRETIEALLLVYAAGILYAGFFQGPSDPPVLIAALAVSLVGLQLIAHVVTTISGYGLLKRRIREAVDG